MYGPWLLVKRKKAVAKFEGHRKLNQGVGVGLGKGYSRNFEAVNRQVYKSCNKPTFSNRHGSDVDTMEVGPGVVGMGLPLVDISIKQIDKRGSSDFRVESAVVTISRAKLERHENRGRGRGKQNLDVQVGCSELLGKRNFQKSDSGRSSNGGVKSSDFIKGDSDRSTRTHGASCTGSGILQEASERVGMKIAEQDGNSESK